MNQSNSLAIILAAGKGTRMNQKVPKPLVKVYQKPIISWIIDSFKINNIDIAVIINPKQESFFEEYNNEAKFVYQKNQRGTGHAVMQASNIIKHYKYVYVFVGDSPFVGQEIIASMYHEHISTNSDVTILSSIFKDKKLPYARLIRDNKKNVKKIIEEIDANNEELKINELFCSHYLFKSKILSNYLLRLKANSKTKEIYFTDILNEMIIDNKNINSIIINDWKKLVGLNTKEDLEWVESQKMI